MSTGFLMPGRWLWGILERIQSGPEDLITVTIAGTERRVGAEVLPRIKDHIGGLVCVANIDGDFHAGAILMRNLARYAAIIAWILRAGYWHVCRLDVQQLPGSRAVHLRQQRRHGAPQSNILGRSAQRHNSAGGQ